MGHGAERGAQQTHTHIDLKRIGSVGPEVSMQHWSKENLEKDSNRQKKKHRITEKYRKQKQIDIVSLILSIFVHFKLVF